MKTENKITRNLSPLFVNLTKDVFSEWINLVYDKKIKIKLKK